MAVTYFDIQKLPAKVHSSLPQLAKHSFSLLPMAPFNYAASEILNKLYRTQINDGDLDFLRDKTILLTVKDINQSWAFTLASGKIRVFQNAVETNATISSNFDNFFQLFSQEADPDTLFFSREMSIGGDTELALEFKSFFENHPLIDDDAFSWGILQSYIKAIRSKP
ncbi:SCP2 domain-containing protein [Teredinibacter sp. KSP-S5-2]|uniref:ubiquinone anaerobic biosynthesis accessory factor UbiT n=1 Tax=Teredinibacter sp. KSP-S5-2 TaxID=3034506 RepID=UPI0029352733|nr:SCP2 sterol-binding domain-containing protein [Teredinibacter sp. KSP-S5-2]WNO10093.1 SCP2 sterol-binding domain-containing protein [Teredinibacter sp. KSP-S5-2]